MAERGGILVDYEERLLDFIDTLGVGFPIYTDTTSENSSISVAMLPGSRTIQEYYDDAKDKEFIQEIQVKAKNSEREEATQALMKIGEHLSDVPDIPSEAGSYDFNGIEVTNEMFFSEATTDGWLYFRLQIKSYLTIY